MRRMVVAADPAGAATEGRMKGAGAAAAPRPSTEAQLLSCSAACAPLHAAQP